MQPDFQGDAQNGNMQSNFQGYAQRRMTSPGSYRTPDYDRVKLQQKVVSGLENYNPYGTNTPDPAFSRTMPGQQAPISARSYSNQGRPFAGGDLGPDPTLSGRRIRTVFDRPNYPDYDRVKARGRTVSGMEDFHPYGTRNGGAPRVTNPSAASVVNRPDYDWVKANQAARPVSGMENYTPYGNGNDNYGSNQDYYGNNNNNNYGSNENYYGNDNNFGNNNNNNFGNNNDFNSNNSGFSQNQNMQDRAPAF